MKIVMIMPFYRDDLAQPELMLERYALLRLLPDALARTGHSVTVLVLSPVGDEMERGGVRYEFIRPPRLGEVAGRKMHARKPRYGPAYYVPITRLIGRLRSLCPDVVHFFGLTMDIHLALTLNALRRKKIPVVVHYHGGAPAQSWRLRKLQGHNLKRLSRVLFTTHEQAAIWIESGLGLRRDQISIILESSSPFGGMDRREARCQTGMGGEPAYLSAARLHPVKDILTTLRGYALVHSAQPDSRLYLYYQSEEMLGDVVGFLSERPELAASVDLRGSVPADQMEAVYSSADFLLQASLREWSGLAVMEAMSCGCIPIVSNIPSFAAITGGGRFGRLFEPGDAEGLAAAALSIGPDERLAIAAEVRRHFHDNLSFEALARDVERVYESVVTERS